jgi:hypothetical protein
MDEHELTQHLHAANASAERGLHAHHAAHTEPAAARLRQALPALIAGAEARLGDLLHRIQAPYRR